MFHDDEISALKIKNKMCLTIMGQPVFSMNLFD